MYPIKKNNLLPGTAAPNNKMVNNNFSSEAGASTSGQHHNHMRHLRNFQKKSITNDHHYYYSVQSQDKALPAKANTQSYTKLLILNDDNFRGAVLKYHLLLVMFYAPWCKYCNDMKPLFQRAAKELPKGFGYMAVCNAEESKKVALEHSVYLYPTLKLYRDGKFLKDYDGPRRSLELINFMIEHGKEYVGD